MLAVEQAEQWFRWEWFFLPFYEIQAILTRLTCVCVTLVSYHLVIPTLCDTRDRSPPGSSVHGILQVRIPEWVAVPFSRGSSWPSEWTRVFCIAGLFFTTSATEVFLSLLNLYAHCQTSWTVIQMGMILLTILWNSVHSDSLGNCLKRSYLTGALTKLFEKALKSENWGERRKRPQRTLLHFDIINNYSYDVSIAFSFRGGRAYWLLGKSK